MAEVADEHPGSNDLLGDNTPLDPSPELFQRLIDKHGREEASRRWMAMFGPFDGSET